MTVTAPSFICSGQKTIAQLKFPKHKHVMQEIRRYTRWAS